MQKRQIAFNFKGIAQDAINGSVNSQFAYKITNMRISASKNSNVLQLTTEKGTASLRIDQTSDMFIEDSIYLGHCVINNYVVIFVTSAIGDYIYRLDFKNHAINDDCKIKIIFHGDLGFDQNHRIESIGVYENENIQKVYWIDGKNQPRVINIVNEYGDNSINTIYTGFDFMQRVLDRDSSARIKVEKIYTGGMFTSGVIQYGYSLYKLNSQETPIIDITSLCYITNKDRGGSPNEQCGCAFKIYIENNLANDFDYIRIYSIQRNSLNGTPLARVVVDIPFENEVTVIDDGTGGYDIDYTYLQWINQPIIPQTITHKDNTLFFGNYSNINKSIYNDILLNEIDVQTYNWYPDFYDQQYEVRVLDNNIQSGYKWLNQLDTESAGVKGFKYGDKYMLGVQFQDIYGNWSQPYRIGVYEQDKYPIISGDMLRKPIFKCNCREIYDLLQDEEVDNYVRIRPVVSFPSVVERNILCQGIVNPTVFNISERVNGNIFAQASWFFRPYFVNENNSITNTDSYKAIIDDQEHIYGAYAECRHHYPLFPSDDIGSELQYMYFDHTIPNSEEGQAKRPYNTISDIVNTDFSNPIEVYKNYFYVDHSIVTLNSSDIDFNKQIQGLNIDNYNFRIIGIIPFNRNFSKQVIITNSSPLFLNDISLSRGITMAKGFVDNSWKYSKGRELAISSWFDDINCITGTQTPPRTNGNLYDWNENDKQVAYTTYPFQRKYLNNYVRSGIFSNIDPKINIESSETAKKVLSNLKYSNNNIILDQPIQNINDGIQYFTLDNIDIVNQYDNIHKFDDKFYKGNSDDILNSNSMFLQNNLSFAFTEYPVLQLMQGYPIVTSNRFYNTSLDNGFRQIMYYYDIVPFGNILQEVTWDGSQYNYDPQPIITPSLCTQDTVDLTYSSNKHVVLEFGENEDGSKQILPYPSNLYRASDIQNGHNMLWDNQYKRYRNLWQADHEFDNFSFSGQNSFNEFLWLAELYHGTSESYSIDNDKAKYTRQWLPAGKAQQFTDDPNIELAWIEGDTYYQRYDCLKTLPYSDNDYQSVVEIASFMVESHVNLDGRYDENRGLIDNTFINNSNFNLINDVYNQENNFFTYYVLDPEKYNIDNFPTSVIWSNKKTYGESIDMWTKISPVNKLDLDGNKGALNVLRKFRNNIYAFQNSSVSRIRFNDRTALSTVEGLPIQLGSADKVDGYEFINEIIGCQNKFSNIETENGIYFIDNNTPGIYKLGYNEYGNINIDNISKQKLMQRWFENNNDRNALSFYDRNINEVLFNINQQSLVFSLDSGYFSQFINYESAKDVININNHGIAVTIGSDGEVLLHKLRSGEYSHFFGQYKDYGVEFIAYPMIGQDTNGIIRDCIYDNVWYRSDVFNDGNDKFEDNAINNNYISDETFDNISVIDTYQNNDSDLLFDLTEGQKITTLRKKFMMWYARIPRHKYRMQNKNYDRMRDKFIKISLNKHQTENHKMVLSDIAVDCFY